MGWPSSGNDIFRIRSRATELPSTCYATVQMKPISWSFQWWQDIFLIYSWAFQPDFSKASPIKLSHISDWLKVPLPRNLLWYVLHSLLYGLAYHFGFALLAVAVLPYTISCLVWNHGPQLDCTLKTNWLILQVLLLTTIIFIKTNYTCVNFKH